MGWLSKLWGLLGSSLLTGWQSWALRIVVLLAVVGAIFGYGYVKGVESQAPKLAACAAARQKAEDNSAILKGSITRQNAAVDGLKAEADKKVADAVQKAQDAARATQVARNEAARLRAGKANGSDCGQAVKLLREGLK